jgi:uncharacterized delta-60 repeat protein
VCVKPSWVVPAEYSSWSRVTLATLVVAALSGCQPPTEPPPAPQPPLAETFVGANVPVTNKIVGPSRLLSDGSVGVAVLSDDPSSTDSSHVLLSLMRIGSDGVVAPGFSSSKSFPLGSGYATGIVEQRTGRVVVAGGANLPSSGHQYLFGFDPDGSPDPTFGSSGRLDLTGTFGSFTRMNLIALPDDRLIVAAGSPSVVVARITADGALDRSFGSDGRATVKVPTTVDTYSRAASVLRLEDGSVLVVGYVMGTKFSRPLLFKLTADGQLDTSFGDDGTLLIDFDGSNGIAWQALELEGGDLVVAGMMFGEELGFGSRFLMRLDSTGRVRTGFGTNGVFDAGGRSASSLTRLVANADRIALVYLGDALGTGYRVLLFSHEGKVLKGGLSPASHPRSYVDLDPRRLDGDVVVATAVRFVDDLSAEAGILRLTLP